MFLTYYMAKTDVEQRLMSLLLLWGQPPVVKVGWKRWGNSSLPIPFPLFPFPSATLSPFLRSGPSSFPPSLLPPLSFPSHLHPLEVGPLNPARGSGFWGRAPADERFDAFSLKIWHLVATILMIFLRINLSKLMLCSLNSIKTNRDHAFLCSKQNYSLQCKCRHHSLPGDITFYK